MLLANQHWLTMACCKVFRQLSTNQTLALKVHTFWVSGPVMPSSRRCVRLWLVSNRLTTWSIRSGVSVLGSTETNTGFR